MKREGAVLAKLRDSLERNGYKVQYQNIMQVVMIGFSPDAHSIIEESMITFSERAEAEMMRVSAPFLGSGSTAVLRASEPEPA